jgi:hypothetical protein
MKRSLAGIVFVIAAMACGPEPSEPAESSLAGTWKSDAHLYTMSNMRLELIQEPEGIVSGMWFAEGAGGLGGCFPNIPCSAFGHLIGRNTVSAVQLQMLGIGEFQGVLRDRDKLRGIFQVQDSYDTITFARTSTTISTTGK